MSHAFIQSLQPNNWHDDDIINFHVDIHKCRKNIVYFSKYDYAVFRCMDKPEVYNPKKKNLKREFILLKLQYIFLQDVMDGIITDG